jgi:outer membrane receptor protein involved in Fe transport
MSKKESNRYLELKNYQEQGKIRGLELQVKYNLQPSFKINGKTIRAIDYIADFTYTDNTTEELVVEDVKGYKTDIYKLKQKLFTYKYKIEIKET